MENITNQDILTILIQVSALVAVYVKISERLTKLETHMEHVLQSLEIKEN